MRKIILMTSVPLRALRGAGRDISWHLVDEELNQHINDDLCEKGGFLSGRITHELMADFWPTADQDPDPHNGGLELDGDSRRRA